MNKILFYSIIILLFTLGAFLKFSDNQGSIPKGCDEFGYLNLAKSFSENNAFTYENTRPYIKELSDSLLKENVTAIEIAIMLTPYAYFNINNGDKVINQYPPGTSYILSFFSLEIRKKAFPALAMFLLILIPFVAIYKSNNKITYADLLLILFAFIVTLSTPFITELNRVNSLAFTFGMLIAAGFVLNSKPLLSCFLIALTINFRVANILLLFPLIFFVDITFLNWKKNISIVFRYFLVTLFAISPYLIYVYKLLGNPFAPTYSSIDTETTFNFISNIKFYFYSDSGWFVVHLLAVIVLAFLVIYKKIQLKLFLKYMLFPITIYSFFLFHKVQVNYYPYASSMILLGVLFYHLNVFFEEKGFKTKFIFVLSFAIAIVVLIDGLNRFKSREQVSFNDDALKYKVLCNYDIVWCDLLSGTSEYVCNNNGFKYDNFSMKAKGKTITYLKNKNYSQAILLNDNMLPPEEVIREITEMGYEYEIVLDDNLGEILIIK